jgi:hypothetical protein
MIPDARDEPVAEPLLWRVLAWWAEASVCVGRVSFRQGMLYKEGSTHKERGHTQGRDTMNVMVVLGSTGNGMQRFQWGLR